MTFYEPGQEIETEIVAITDSYIFLDLNAKTEGVLERHELEDDDGNVSVKEGEKIKAFFVGMVDGEFRFTTKIAGEKADKSMLENAYKNQIPVEGKVEKEIKGGFEIRIGNTRAFCPFSQMGFKKHDEETDYIGKNLKFIITEYKKDGKDILVSNRKIEEAEYENSLTSLSQSLTEGSVVKASVISLQKFGAFVDIQGFQALLPISEISHSRVKDASEVLSVGQEITVKIIKADWVNKKVSVSMKELEASPWEGIADRYPVGKKIDGKISRIADFGLFIEVEKGIDGLIHISELDTDRNTNLKAKYKVGQDFSVVVKEVNVAQQRLALRPASSVEQDKLTAKYLGSQDDSDGETYNPFAVLLKK